MWCTVHHSVTTFYVSSFVVSSPLFFLVCVIEATPLGMSRGEKEKQKVKTNAK